MRTIEDKNIPSRGSGFNQVLIQVQLIHSLPIVTTMKNTTTTKILDRIFNTGCPQGIPRNDLFKRFVLPLQTASRSSELMQIAPRGVQTIQ